MTAAALLLATLAAAGEISRYAISDRGDFLPRGQRVEFADRYGWRQYQVDFDFGLDTSARTLTRDSKLTLRVSRRDGPWSYSCRGKGRDPIYANINFLFGKGISVVAECRIPEKQFAKAVDLHPDDVGVPNLVFHVLISDGQARLGAQRGIYFLPGGQIESSELNAYAASHDDPSSLAVIFRSSAD